MNIITKLFSKLHQHIISCGWVPKEGYDELRNSAMYIDEQYKNKKLLVEKLEEELITVNTNYSNYVSEKTKEINTLKATIESLDETVIFLNTEQDRLLNRIKIMKENFKYLLKEQEKELDKNKLHTKSILSYKTLLNKALALLIISIIGNFYQALT